jgi:hypothetical protein
MTTTTDGKNESIVWYMSGVQPDAATTGTGAQQSTLEGVDGDSGQPVYTGTEACGLMQRWTSPIAVRGRIIVGATGRLCAYSAP